MAKAASSADDDVTEQTPGCFSCWSRPHRRGSRVENCQVTNAFGPRRDRRRTFDEKYDSNSSMSSCSLHLDSTPDQWLQSRPGIETNMVWDAGFARSHCDADLCRRCDHDADDSSMMTTDDRSSSLGWRFVGDENDHNETTCNWTSGAAMSDEEFYNHEKEIIMDQMRAMMCTVQSERRRQSTKLHQRQSECQSLEQTAIRMIYQADTADRMRNKDQERQMQLIKCRLEERRRRKRLPGVSRSAPATGPS